MVAQKRISLSTHAIMSFIFGVLLYIGYFASNPQLILFISIFSILFIFGAIIPGLHVLVRHKEATLIAKILAAIGFFLGALRVLQIFF